MKRILFYIMISAVATAATAATSLAPPLKGELSLSANFGELRPNHFHSGLDFKTGGETGKPILAVADGYVSGVEVSPWGFGRAVYVTHPALGLVTVYGHLEAFAPEIDRVVRAEQYRRKSFNIEMEWGPETFPVKAGREIGKSGNAGSSGGPHLHFDVRDLATGDPMDPLPYYKHLIPDTDAPYWSRLYLYPDGPRGTVNGRRDPAEISKGDERMFTAWGRVFPAIKCNDAMTGNSNIYGVKTLVLEVDGRAVMGRCIDRFSLGSTRAINTLVDYGRLMRDGTWAQWSYVPLMTPAVPLTGFTPARGAVIINSERDYKCKWVLIDEHGNRAEAPFTIRGVRPAVEVPYKPLGTAVRAGGLATFHLPGMVLELPRNAFAGDVELEVTSTKSNTSALLSDIYTIDTKRWPLMKPGLLTMSLPVGVDATKMCIVRVNESGTPVGSIGGMSFNGMIAAEVSRPGRYAIAADRNAPTIEYVAGNRATEGYLAWRVTDDISGVDTYNVTIDGKWALAELDGKNDLVEFKMDPERFKRGGNHVAQIVVTDGVGNTATHRINFTW